ncbi:G-type lectin S-receptor-like serine/threonine-protein kinase [Morus notabilis]|uniref:non-specific serine/threonine protein kinase n=1 Tax=Morus notabilis TaxID=981085 RepID=W9SIC7_9ROSA|nr:G-type lectin S-receptor-like serine/threonine-protein kinase [Morus notabilis]
MLESWIWLEADQKWGLYSTVPRDECDKYGLCGANGICNIDANPFCQCLVGFKPKSQWKWDLMDWSDGCVRKTPLNCLETDKGGFIKVSGLKLPDATHSRMFTRNLSPQECRDICINNCSCMAYGNGCVVWYGDLIDISTIRTGGHDLFIRLSLQEIAKLNRRKYYNMVRAVVVVASVIGGVSGMLLLGYCICRKRSKDTKKNRAKEEDFELPLFSLAAVSIATNNFSANNKLGEGGFGPVYRGKLEDGQEIAVKRLSLSSRQGVDEFKNELILIAKLQHRNLVKLLGYQQQSTLLEWPKRFEIICGIARGLQYLHQDSRLRIVHRDLKASNILLDNMMNPKISDFGLAKTFGGDQTEGNTNRIAGTHGYMAPEYAFNGLFSTKSDVFSFGILVLEIISGKRCIRFHHENRNLTLIGYAWMLLNEGRPFELIDVCLRDSYDNLPQVLRFIHVGLLCVQQHPMDRPRMSSVVLMLGSESELPHPKRPGYFMEIDSQERDYVPNKPESSSKNTMTLTALGGR